MSKRPLAHPAPEDLVCHADGETGARAARRIRGHLEACWECRSEMDRLQEDVRAAVEYRHAAAALLPPPPAPWRDLRPAMERLREAPPALGVLAWLARPLYRWVPAAAALLLAGAVLIYRLNDTPTVRAAELLRRAVAASEARPAAPRLIQIRTTGGRLTRAAGAASVPDESGKLREIESLFRNARYDWSDPLSARAYLAWHAQLSQKEDEVVRGSDGAFFEVRTTTASSPLEHAMLRLGARDLDPVEGVFRFRDHEPIEITLVPGSLEAPPVPSIEPPRAASPPVAPAPPGILHSGELRAVAALQRIGADLGDPVELARSGSELVVTGLGVGAERQRQIREALADVERVSFRFSGEAAPAPVSGIERRPEAASPPSPSPLEQYFTSRAEFDRFAELALAASESLAARAHALRRLAVRFPPTVEQELTQADRGLLDSLRLEHAGAAHEGAVALRRIAAPVLRGLDVPASAAGLPVPAWQDAAEALFDLVRRTERVLAALLGLTPEQTARPAELGQLLEQLTLSTNGLRQRPPGAR